MIENKLIIMMVNNIRLQPQEISFNPAPCRVTPGEISTLRTMEKLLLISLFSIHGFFAPSATSFCFCTNCINLQAFINPILNQYSCSSEMLILISGAFFLACSKAIFRPILMIFSELLMLSPLSAIRRPG